MKTTACRKCGASIYFVEIAGKNMPIDATPSSAGTLAVRAEEVRGRTILTARAVSRTSPILPGETAYISHFATCPHANEFRQPSPSPSQSTPARRPIRPARFAEAQRIAQEANAPWAIIIYPGERRLEAASWGENAEIGRKAALLLDDLCERAEPAFKVLR